MKEAVRFEVPWDKQRSLRPATVDANGWCAKTLVKEAMRNREQTMHRFRKLASHFRATGSEALALSGRTASRSVCVQVHVSGGSKAATPRLNLCRAVSMGHCWKR